MVKGALVRGGEGRSAGSGDDLSVVAVVLSFVEHFWMMGTMLWSFIGVRYFYP